MRAENTEPTRMVNLANADRSRIGWERYRDFIIWRIEWNDYDGERYGHYGVMLDGEWVTDSEHGWLLNVIDQWYAES